MQRKHSLLFFTLLIIIVLLSVLIFAACATHMTGERVGDEGEISLQTSVQTSATNESSMLTEELTEDVSEPEDLYHPEIPMSDSYQKVMARACQEYGVPYSLALAVAECESSFDMEADSGSCWGLMQIHPINYEWLRELGIEPTEYEGNITAGVLMLGMYLDKYSDTHKALMAYNLGETGARRKWDNGVSATQYSEKVVSVQTKWQEIIDN